MIPITPDIAIDEAELHETFVRAGGPGGQNVNKVATAVHLRFDVANSPGLPEDVRHRLLQQQAQQITQDGVLVIKAARYRSQEQNRQDARERLVSLIQDAAVPPANRHATKPTRASRQQRVATKRQHSAVKKLRRSPARDE